MELKQVIKVGNRLVGGEYPAFIIAEIGINHNGDVHLKKVCCHCVIEAIRK